MKAITRNWSLYTLVMLCISGLFMSSCCKNHVDDSYVPYGKSKALFYMTKGTAYKLSMVNNGNGNMYFATGAGTTISKLNVFLNGKNGQKVPATVFFNDSEDVRSVTINGVTYVIRKNSLGGVDVTVINGTTQQLFTNVMTFPQSPTIPATGDALKDNMNRAMVNLYAILPVINYVNAGIKAGGGELSTPTAGVAGYVSQLYEDVSEYTSNGTTVTEVTNAEFMGILNTLSEDVPGLEDLDGKTYGDLENAIQNDTDSRDREADRNTKDGEGAIVSGSGKLKVTLTWYYGADIDLHVFEPGFTNNMTNYDSSGQGHIYYAAKTNTFTDGYLDFDNTHGYFIDPTGENSYDMNRAAIENIYWSEVIDGVYYIYLHYYASKGDSWCNYVTEGPCTVSVYVNGRGYNKTVDMTTAYRNNMLYIGKVTFPAGTIDLTSPEPNTPTMQSVLRKLPRK